MCSGHLGQRPGQMEQCMMVRRDMLRYPRFTCGTAQGRHMKWQFCGCFRFLTCQMLEGLETCQCSRTRSSPIYNLALGPKEGNMAVDCLARGEPTWRWSATKKRYHRSLTKRGLYRNTVAFVFHVLCVVESVFPCRYHCVSFVFFIWLMSVMIWFWRDNARLMPHCLCNQENPATFHHAETAVPNVHTASHEKFRHKKCMPPMVCF